MRRLVVLSVLVAGSAVSLSAAPATAVPVCQGQPATIVGGSDDKLYGTDGPDVIVTHGATYVYAEAGDDLVCITGRRAQVWVNAGDGDDSVAADGKRDQRFRVDLGPGGDRFAGGVERDYVKTFDPLGAPSRDDEVATGPGNDVVLATRPTGPATHDAERVDLGKGRDVLAMGDSGLAPTASVDGGPGRDEISVNSDNEGTDVTIDTEARTIDRGGPYLSSWSSFEDYFVKEFGADVTFEGSSRAERLRVAAADTYAARMHGGDDIVTMASIDKAHLAGGGGRDQVVVEHSGAEGGAWVDLAHGQVGTLVRHPRAYASIGGFEDATAIGPDPLVIGDAKANRLVASCGTVRGRGGADRIEENTPAYLRYPHPDACRDFVARGGGGADVLVGSQGPDVLLGGTGRDRANGLRGRDRCVAEVERGCER